MKLLCGVLLLCGFAGAAIAMPETSARQLLLHSGFTPSAAELSATAKLSPDTAVQRIVDRARARTQAVTAPPAWVSEDDPIGQALPPKDADVDTRREYRQKDTQRTLELMAWWMREMQTTDTPLTERMTLFWHGHFTSEMRKVRVPVLMVRQNQMFRRYALGNYRELLHAMIRDPAMLIYLDTRSSHKREPNENFARELLELFTLGEGHYSETDIKEAARAFTGYGIERSSGEFVFRRDRHDAGTKTVLGRSGDLDGDDVIDAILAQPQAAQYLVECLWREFVSPVPDPAVVQKLAAQLRKNWELAPLMVALLRQPAVLDAQAAGQLVKSPVELVVGTLRFTGMTDNDGYLPAIAAAAQGQILFDPPNVRGWPGGDSWISSNSLLARQQFLHYLCGDPVDNAGDGAPGGAMVKDVLRQAMRSRDVVTQRFGAFAESLSPQAAPQFLALAPVQPVDDGATPEERLRSWLLDPGYQLK